MVHVNNFTYGPVTPVLGYVMSCLGCFLGLRCTTRARATRGAQRARWLLLATVSIATTGIWVMHFVAMLGFTIPGQTITYNVPVTILPMVIAVLVVGTGLLIVGFGGSGRRPLLLGGIIIGLGVASMHYLGMDAMSIPEMMQYNIPLVVLSVLIAIAAGTVALWAGLKVRGIWSTLAAALLFGVAVTGMHYTGMAAMKVYAATAGVYGAGQGLTAAGEPASSFVMPLVLGIGIFSFLALIVIMLAPSEEEIRADARLAERLAEWPASHRR